MAYSFRHTSPELAGVLIKEAVRCGKPNCRCMRQNKPHKWYYYLYWRDYRNNGILRKRYVPKSEIRKLRQNIKSAKTKDMEEKQTFKTYLDLIKQLL